MENVVIITTTKYESTEDLRYKLFLKTLEEVAALDCPIFVADQSDKKVFQSFPKRPETQRIIHLDEATMGSSRRFILKKALADHCKDQKLMIVWMEPEKHSFVLFIPEIVAFMIESSADLVIPCRKSMKSYPYLQQLNEPLGNEIFRIITGVNLDIYFGPQVFRASMAKHYLNHTGNLWDATHCPVIDILDKGCKVREYQVNYQHPQEQKTEETWEMVERRLKQLNILSQAYQDEILKCRI